MALRQIAVTALLAAAATTITQTTVHAEPAPDIPQSVSGVHDGVGYTVSTEGTQISATLTGGTFRTASDGVDVLDPSGHPVAHLPLRIAATDTVDVTLTPRVDGATLIADASAEEIGTWRQTSPRQRSIEAGIGLGGAAGAITGVVVGLALGLLAGGLLIPITLPIALIVGVLGGMAIGGAAGASIPNSDVPDQWDYQEECKYSGDYRFCW